MSLLKKSLVIILITGVVSCAYHPGRYDSGLNVTESFAEDIVINDVVIKDIVVVDKPEMQWWATFNDPTLVKLMGTLNENNHDINIANQRIDRFKALLGFQMARNRPWLQGALSKGTDINHNTDEYVNDSNLAFSASYELDLWGRRSAENTSAKLRLMIEEQNFNSVALQMQSQLAIVYFEALSLQEKNRLTKENLKATKELYQLVKLRFDSGISSRIELDQQQNIMLSQQSLLLQLDRDLIIKQRAIAVLLGKDHFDHTAYGLSLDDVQLPAVTIVQPANLLQSRPDIRVAEYDLKLSDAELFAAKTRRWPSLSLSAQVSVVDVLHSLDVITTTMLGSIVAPIFEGGRIENRIDAAKIETSIKLESYRKTVIQAMQETLDNLTRLHYQKQLHQLNVQEFENSDRLHEQAKKQYKAGATDFLNLLEAQRSLFDVKERLVNSKMQYLASIVNTFKAMGNSPLIEENDNEDFITHQ